MSERAAAAKKATPSTRAPDKLPAALGPTTARQRWATGLDVLALFVVLLVVGMRPLISETYYSQVEAMTEAAAAGAGGMSSLTPATTAWFDFAIWGAAVLAAGASLLARRSWRLTGAEIGAALLVVGATLSTITASNKRLAMNASADWLTAIVLVMVLANLCRDRLRIGLVLAVVVASGMASVTKCAMQEWLEYKDTWQHYTQNKADFWARQNVPLDDPRVELYERRMKSTETTGFFSLSNLQGAWLSLAGFAALAARAQVLRRRKVAVGMLVLAGILFAAVLWTRSKGAIASAGIGLAAYLFLTRYHAELKERWRLVLLGLWLSLAGIISAGVSFGVVTGRLPGDSLRFRWNYWQVTSDIISQHLVSGVGALNFDAAYLARKPVQFPEEIRDPHNFILSILSQWGLMGGVGLLLVFLGGSTAMARAWGTREPTDTRPPIYDPQARYLGLQWTVAMAIGFVLLRLWLMSGWLGTPSGNAYVFFDLGLYGLVWLIVFGGVFWVIRGGWLGDIDVAQVACLAGVLAFVLHSLVDLPMTSPGTLYPFAAIVGLLAGGGLAEGMRHREMARPALPLIIAALGSAIVAGVVLVPVTKANYLLEVARGEWGAIGACWRSFPRAKQALEQAAEVDPWDPTAPAELARAYVTGSGDLGLALRSQGEAIRRDPEQISLYRGRAELLEMSFHHTGSAIDVLNALATARKVTGMYPGSPDDHVWFADMLARNSANGANELVDEAIAQYRWALELDSRRAAGEIRRWPAARRQAVIDRMHALINAVASQPASAPQ